MLWVEGDGLGEAVAVDGEEAVVSIAVDEVGLALLYLQLDGLIGELT